METKEPTLYGLTYDELKRWLQDREFSTGIRWSKQQILFIWGRSKAHGDMHRELDSIFRKYLKKRVERVKRDLFKRPHFYEESFRDRLERETKLTLRKQLKRAAVRAFKRANSNHTDRAQLSHERGQEANP